ncbi:spatacsin-like isoform X1 [Mytilus galloprovincialis]|uniref:spatacsin-like isoform X1 n=1 Tax=Mytilus galloprovincialis TaxID=29158 RepID=UPI003F7B36D0
MADIQSPEILKCYIHRFGISLSFKDITSLKICQSQRYISIEKENSLLEIIKLDTKQNNVKPVEIESVKQIVWCTDHSNTVEGSFVCLKQDGSLLCYNKHTKIVLQQNINEVIVQEDKIDFEDFKLTTYYGNHLIVKIKDELVVMEIQQAGYKIMTSIVIPNNPVAHNVYDILTDFVAVFDSETTIITVYNITNGDIVATVNLSRTNIETDRMLSWGFTPDLKYLIVMENTFTITSINIESYTQQFPSCVTKTKLQDIQFSNNEVLNTIHVGDSTWRRKLLTIHDQNSKLPTKPWYFENKSNSSNVKPQTSRWRASGFWKKSRTKSQSSISKLEGDKKIHLPATLQGMNIVDFVVGKFSVSLHLQSPKENVICVCDIQKQTYNIQRLPVKCFVMLSAQSQFPHLVAMETHLTCIVPCIEQEEFVSLMMTYAGASVADVLCHINKWGRCSLPLHTLEIGVKHRQLDTVVFFLKSKENLFSSTKSYMTSPASPPVASPSWSFSSNHYDNIIQLQPALELLIQSISDNLTDSQSQDFVKRLSDITLEFLYGLLSDALDVQESVKYKMNNESEVEDMKKSIDVILEDIADIRQCLRKIERERKLKDGIEEVKRVPDTDHKALGNKTDDEIIQDAVLSNTIPTVQASLLEKGDNSRADINHITNCSIVKAVKYLWEKQSKPAIAILSNLGLNVNSKLWEVAAICEDRTIRDFIIEELTGRKCLTEEQMEIVEYVNELEKKYPTSSFSSAVKDARKQEVPLDRLENIFLSFGDSPEYDLSSECGDLSAMVSEDHQNIGKYSHVLLDWVQRWDPDTKDLVIMVEDPKELKLVHLRYLLRYNKLEKLLLWIQKAVEKDFPIMHQLLEHLAECTSYIKLVITEACARKGVFLKTEEFNTLVSDLRLVGGALELPHPLSNSTLEELENFHRDFIQYCVKNNLPTVVWQYCTTHKLSYSWLKKFLHSNEECCWLSMLVSMYRLRHKPNDCSAMVDASISNGQLIWSLKKPEIGEIVKNGEVLTAMATAMYSENKLQQIVGDQNSAPVILGIENTELEKALQIFPKLHSALFPALAKESAQNDVTIYQLLMDNAPFDPRKLFGWQPVNTLASDESPKEMPYFSQPDLVNKYGYTEKIRYMYYLKQGRPSFAFVSFLAEAYDMEPTGITQQRIQDATNTALWIGVKNFSNTQVASTCVVFMEMLGQDTCILRTYLQVGNEILSDLNSNVTGNVDKRKELVQKNDNDIVSWICACVLRRGKNAKLLLQKLEDAILNNLDKENINRTSFEAGQKWTIAVLFCHLLHIPLTTKYLELTAKSDRWLPFLWFSQMHQYSKEQLQSQLYHFKSQHLQQHLHYVIENAEVKAQGAKVTEKSHDKKKGNKDVRSTLYSRIGLAKDINQERSSSEDEIETQDVSNSSMDIDETELIIRDSEAVSDDLFSVVFHAQSSRSPWKYLLVSGVTVYNPILTELAVCLENASLITCMCGWLVCMMNEQEHDRFLEDYGKTIWKWNMKHLNHLIEIYLKHKWNRTLMTCFHIFLPDCTILPFLKFSAELIDTRDHTLCRKHLQEFKEAVSMAASSDGNDYQQTTVLHDSDWIQQTTYKILLHHFTHTTNLYDLHQLLRILDTESAVLLFKFDVPDFGKLSRLLNIAVNNQILDVNFPQLISSKDQFDTECQRIVMVMIQRGFFQAARDLSTAAKLNSDHVTLSEVRNKKQQLEKSSVWKSATARNKFWLQCYQIFKKNKAESITSQFYKEEAEKIEDFLEKSFLYQLCLDNLESCKDPPPYEELYRQMWMCRIQYKTKHKGTVPTVEDMDDVFQSTETIKQHHSKKDLLCFGKLPQKSEIDSSLNIKEDTALNGIMEELLENGQVCECCHLSAEFKHYNRDLTIILTCIRLALGEVSIRENMDMDMVNLVSGGPGKLHRASVSMPAMLTKSSSSGNLMVPMGPVTYSCFGIEMEKVVVTMETLCSHCNHGNQFCKQIINCFIISLVLATSYESVVNSEAFDILRSLLETNFLHKVKLAADFLSNSSLSPAEVAGFLSESFVTSYKVKHGLIAVKDKRELIFDESIGVVTQFIKLCSDPSLLGDRLLDAVTSLSVDQDLMSPKVLAMQTDLLILAHSCHTVACNMEGISNVLRAARAMTACLQSTQQFSLMVQLLTGIGRFGEMTYIFDSIKQNERFELLLKKGIDREDSLKLAMLDYLKRYHPKDKETYDMVAHNFMLHRQIAQTLETRANSTLDGLKGKTLENIPDVQTTLQNIIQYFTDAAERYFKEKCVRHAQKCVRQARLVALQLHYLPAGNQLLHLSDEEADDVICQHPKFLEALILSQSYGRRSCWSDALCHNVIMNGDFRYLKDFKQHLKLSPTQIKEAAERYQHTPNKTNSSMNNLKKLLTFCKDIKLQYSLAVEFSLKDIVTSLENGDSGAYIKDIIANKT